MASSHENKEIGDNATTLDSSMPISDDKVAKADAGNVDEAYAAVQGYGDVVVDAATDRRLLRTIDRHILPIMCVIYGM